MKTVLITGGSRGIGKCIAENLAKDGFNVVLNYNKSEKQAKSNLEKETYKKIKLYHTKIEVIQ